jgi:hypothetical protein
MSDGLLQFWKSHPFWTIFIIIFAILPIGGAIVHIILKAFGRKGLDNTMLQQSQELPENKTEGNVGDESSSNSDQEK